MAETKGKKKRRVELANETETVIEDNKPKEKEKQKAKEPLKPYVYIDTFLHSVAPIFKLNGVQARGFKTHMEGKHYQRDEQVFMKELRKYLNIK